MANQPKNPVQTDDGWSTDSEESATQIKFTIPGSDVFTGIKVGVEVIDFDDRGEKKSFTRYLFRSVGNEKDGLSDGEMCAVAESYRLRKLDEIDDGRLVEITYTKNVEVGQPAPMKDFRVRSRMATAAERELAGL